MRALALAALLASPIALAETIGEVSTVFKWLGPNDKVVVEAFDDPKVEGVTCYLSRARTGGISGGLGLAEDRSEASLECMQTGEIRFRGELKDGEEVFKERTSLVFKSMQVVRFHDRKRNTLVCLQRPHHRRQPAELADRRPHPPLVKAQCGKEPCRADNVFPGRHCASAAPMRRPEKRRPPYETNHEQPTKS